MARPDLGAGGANPMDWDGCVLTFVHKETGDIYDCTVSVKEVNANQTTNVIAVDMRNILPRLAHQNERAGHAMFIRYGSVMKNSMCKGKLSFFMMMMKDYHEKLTNKPC